MTAPLKAFTIFFTILLIQAAGLIHAQTPPADEIHPVAPDEITDEELTAFMEASDALRPIQSRAREDLREAIESEGISMDRFQQIAMAMQNPQGAEELDLTPEEEEALENLQSKLMEIEMEARDNMIDEIATRGLNVARYQQIYLSLREHSELMERLENLSP